ncbi:MAG: hypothetical protein OEY24_03460 [Candidatus Bathyarchaeota archaeon]|nr:hypothetical protein [Candidatus Bathyarchaeota archaeon]MDH5494742.1 hypothetical protein [Candidatus Bathyarchaeota archaeon]
MNTTTENPYRNRHQIVNVPKDGEIMTPTEEITKTYDGLRPAHQPKNPVTHPILSSTSSYN